MQNKAKAQSAEQEELLAQDLESKRILAAALQQAFKRMRELESDSRDCSDEIDRIKGEQSSFVMQHSVKTASAARGSSKHLLREGEVLKSQDALLVALVPSRSSDSDGGIFETDKETVMAAKMALDVVIASIPEGTENGLEILTAACKALHRYYFGDDIPAYFGFTIFQQNLSARVLKLQDWSYLSNTAWRRDFWADAAARLVIAKIPSGLVGDVFGLPVAGHLGDSFLGGSSFDGGGGGSGSGSGSGSSGGGGGGSGSGSSGGSGSGAASPVAPSGRGRGGGLALSGGLRRASAPARRAFVAHASRRPLRRRRCHAPAPLPGGSRCRLGRCRLRQREGWRSGPSAVDVR
jgi:hypothetical protein